MRYDQMLSRVVEANGADQHYACCLPFLGYDAETRFSTIELCRVEMWNLARWRVTFGQVSAGGRTCVMLGQNLVLRPTPEYARMTRVGVEAPYVWRFNENDLWDQVDDICTADRLRPIAVEADGAWFARFSELQDVTFEKRRRTQKTVGESLESALWRCVRAFRTGDGVLEPPSYRGRTG